MNCGKRSRPIRYRNASGAWDAILLVHEPVASYISGRPAPNALSACPFPIERVLKLLLTSLSVIPVAPVGRRIEGSSNAPELTEAPS
jgi:hypothetical protein